MEYRTRAGRSKNSSSSVSMGRAPCCDKANVKKGAWSPEEDAKLKSYIDQNGTGGNWIALPQKIGLKRCGKSCRLRWLNYLRPNIKHGGFSEEEDNLICRLYISIGSRWSIIAAQLPGRTDNDIKNYWNTRLKKKLLGKQQRKDHQPVRAKQEEKSRYLHAITPIGDADGSRSTYWPEPYTYHHIEDEQASIDKLLTRLGCQLNPLMIAQPEDMYSDAAADLIVAPTMHTDNSFVDSLQGPAGFPNELDEMFHCNQVKLEGLGFYGSGDEINEGMQWEWYTGDERELEGDKPSNQPPEES